MIRINLLPHREAKRKQKKAAFVRLAGARRRLGAGGGAGGRRLQRQPHLDPERAQRWCCKTANAELDKKIDEIATLKQEIEALKARQQAVEDLQGDRNQPVYLIDELVRRRPRASTCEPFKQEGQRVVLTGYAAVARSGWPNCCATCRTASPWLERPDLTEVRAAGAGPEQDGQEGRSNLRSNVGIKRPRDKDAGRPSRSWPAASRCPRPRAAHQDSAIGQTCTWQI